MTCRTDPQFKVRLPPDLKEWLKRQAKVNHRTMTTEIAYRLEVARDVAEGQGAASAAQ